MSNQVARSSKGLYSSRNSNDYIIGSGTQALVNSVPNVLLFDTIEVSDRLDDKLSYSAGTWTVLKAGVFLLNAHVDFDANTTGTRQVYFSINGVAKGTVNINALSTGSSSLGVSWSQYLAAGSVFTITGVQDSGIVLNITNLSRMTITWL